MDAPIWYPGFCVVLGFVAGFVACWFCRKADLSDAFEAGVEHERKASQQTTETDSQIIDRLTL